jgi:lipopolysaccharide export system permease protein
MKTFYRSMLKDFIGPFFLSGAIMAGILLLDKVFLLVDLLVRKGVNIALVGELMLSSLPFVLSFCIPMGVLIASVMVFGRLVHDNELTAIRSSGINPMRLFRPLLFFVAGTTIIMIFFNGYVLPEASHHARNLITDIAQKKPAVRIYENAFLDDFPGYIIYIGSIDERTGKVNDVTIWQKNDFSTPTLIKAKTGRIITSPDQKYITIDLDAGEISELITKDKYRHLAFSSHQINLPIDDEFSRRERKYRSDREMVLNDLYAHTRSISKDINSLNKDVAKYKQTPENEVSKYRYDDAMTRLRYKHNEFNQYATEIEKKYALACSCLIFLFFGAGLGLLIKRSGLGFGFVTGLLFFAVYYIILIAGEEFADAGRITPFIGIWFANLILIPITLLLLSLVGFEANFTKRIFYRAK